ncbi:MAG: 1-(5-phosphoribosyl)-5-[(5-phosphoribosylamino) methylideneamino] imidazole-4-carboxamide isomerase [Gaiellaceae bacterium]|jgi:phosphoribosylformimino-5-aminoimidazole carboxamide ribotide isomerase|nr:MAG: 1-(5-phosphoribosyl)-5-[(5-phosphoribosylamino) methylideneamino] imidazole-4-carboxamide isomerase [Gaiellaceae bacterium]
MVTRKYGDEVRTGFEVVPAIDLLGDEAVRLEQGAFDRVVARESDPRSLARRFVAAGARTIHVVDLAGARDGRCRPEVIADLARAAAPAAVQASGGVRAPEDARALVAAGAERVVVGTAAWETADGVERYVEALGERLVVAIDVRGGRVVARGWTEDAGLTVAEALERCAAARAPRLLCSAVERDGTLAGPDLALLAEVVRRSDAPVLAAGGIRSSSDLEAVAAVGCAGAIVGRALLEGALPLASLAR